MDSMSWQVWCGSVTSPVSSVYPCRDCVKWPIQGSFSFTLESAGLRWMVDNVRHDQAVGASEVTEGTRVRWEMDPTTTLSIAEIFGAYTNDDQQFTKTRTVVRLFGFGVRFVSRSEAKRLMRGLERFEEVILDFTGGEEVGQGFVDEVLRVWPNQHPDTAVEPVGMTGPVEFMVRRGLPAARPRPEQLDHGH
jgi:STAS-like domain of unknown function (DUF4325)